VLLAATSAACGGGATGNSTARSSAPDPRRSNALSAPKSAAFRPAPPVIDRGRDFVAITRSLVLYVRWLEWHHPDPSLVTRVYQVGSPPERVASKHVTELRRVGAHIVEADAAPFELAVISVTPNVVSLRLTEHLSHRELVAANGRVLARDKARVEQYAVSIARANGAAPWRVNLVERKPPRIEVQL
jgi:hypothetical protein